MPINAGGLELLSSFQVTGGLPRLSVKRLAGDVSLRASIEYCLVKSLKSSNNNIIQNERWEMESAHYVRNIAKNTRLGNFSNLNDS